MEATGRNSVGKAGVDGQTRAPGRAMSRFAKLFVLFVSLVGLGLWGGNAYALVCTSNGAGGGNWNAGATWLAGCGAAGPVAGDTVTISTGDTVTVTANAACATLTVNAGGIINASTFRLRPTGLTTINGTINFTGISTSRFGGGVLLNAGGVWANTGNSPITFRGIGGGITNNGGTFTSGTGIYTFDTNPQTIAGTNPVTISNVTVAAIALTNNGTLTVPTALAGTGSLINSATGTLNIGGTSAITTLNAATAGNTVNYNGAAQTANVTTYNNLTLSGSLAKTFVTTPTVNGVLSLEGTATVVATTGVVTYGPAATLQYNKPAAYTATLEEWPATFNGTGGVIIKNTGVITTGAAKVLSSGVPLTIDLGASLTTVANTLNVGGDLTVNGTLTGSTGAITLSGAAPRTIDGTGSITSTTGTLLITTSRAILNTANLTIARPTTLSAATTVTNNGIINKTTTAALNGANATTSIWVNAANSTLNYAGTAAPMATGVFDVSATGNTVNYNGAGQTVEPPGGATPAYYHLTLSGSAAKTMGATTINGDFTMSGAATTAPTGALAVGGNFTIGTGTTFTAGAFNHTVSGNFDATGTFTSTGTVTLNGAAAQTISGTDPVAFNTLNVTNGANPNITLATNVTATTLTGTVTLTPSCPDFTLTSTTPAQVLHTCTTVISINRLDTDPTSAATVRWTVTFSRSVTGADATAFSLVPSGGVSGTFITTVTGSGTTWTVTANTGIGAGTLGLNQTGPGAVVPTLAGTFTGQVYTITSTPALAEYRMDEASWNGTANEVVDSSGNGNHAQAFNLANTEDVSRAIPGSPGTCRNGVFDNGTTITQGYVQTPLPDLNTDFTVTAWIRTTDNTVGAQRILIDDQGTAPATGYGFSLGEAGTGKLRFYSRGITPISFDSTYTIANNTWYFVAAVADITNKKRTIYVFDAAGTLLNSTPEAAAFTGAWGTDGGPVSIGAETNASAETPAANHFKGNIDEVRVYQKVLGQSALAAIATQSHVCPAPPLDHISIEHANGQGLTCTPSTLTIKACMDALCSTLYTGGVTGTLTASAGPTVNWVGGTGFSIPNGSGSITKDVQVTTGGSTVFGTQAGTVSPAPSGTSPTCNFGSPACTFTSADSGLLFDVLNHVSETLQNITVSAVKKADNSLACVPAFGSVSKSVNFTCSYTNPASGTLPGRVGGRALNAGNNAGAACDGTGQALSLDFNASGVAGIIAPITVQYADVGNMTLNAQYTGSGADAGLVMTGTDTFVAKPDHFDLTGIKRTSDNFANPGAASAADICGGTSTADCKFVKAGESFTVTVMAKNALGNTTKNYGQETVAESVKLTSALVGGLGLTNNPAISGTFGAFSNGVAIADGVTFLPDGITRSTPFTWNEAGIITLTPSVADTDYLGAGDVTGTTSGNVGRFYAAKFALSGGVIANRTDIAACPAPAGCGTFTYMGEQMSAVFNLTAKAVDGTTTLLNYNWSATAANQFAKLNPLASVTAGTGGPLGLGAVDSAATRTPFPPCEVIPAHPCLTPAQATAGTFASGVASVTVPFTLYRDNAIASGPFSALDVAVAPQDSDGAIMAAYDRDTVNVVAGANNHTLVDQTIARYGRIRVANAYGSERLTLTVRAAAQYYNGSSSWVPSVTDNVSSLTLAATYDVVKNGVTTGTTTPAPTGVATLTGGILSIVLGIPTGGATGNATINSTNTPTPIYLPLLSGQATFGVYQGRREFIYMRENY